MKNKIKLSEELRAFISSNDMIGNKVLEIRIKDSYVYSLDQLSLKYHKDLAILLSNNVILNNACCGFVKGKSYLDFLSPHKESIFFMRLDISKFFHSIDTAKIKEFISPLFNKKDFDMDILISKLTHEVDPHSENYQFSGATILPMGFPCSPVISNLIFRPIDIIISKYCLENNIIYSRYADDMLFSSGKKLPIINGDLKSFVCKLLLKNGLSLNTKKTVCTENHLSLNGYVIDGEHKNIRLSNDKLNKINKLTHEILISERSFKEIGIKIFGYGEDNIRYQSKKMQFFDAFCKDQILNKIKGYRSYLIGILKFGYKNNSQTEKTVQKYNKIIKRLEFIITKYNK